LPCNEKDFAIVRRFLRKDFSPEQIVGIIRRFRLMKLRVSRETIDRYIWRDKSSGSQLWRHPSQSSKQAEYIKEPLQNPSLRYPKGIKERSDEAIFKCLIFKLKIASLRSCALQGIYAL